MTRVGLSICSVLDMEIPRLLSSVLESEEMVFMNITKL